MLHRRALLGGLGVVWLGTAQGRSQPKAPALGLLREGGCVMLVRHARAPGTGDPPGFRIGDCATQRNLSAEGREQAAALGRSLREAGIRIEAVRSSRWCRALDTARLAFPDIPVEPDPALDSFFGDGSSRDRQTEAARALVAGWRGRSGVLALVTHQVNVTALTRLFPAEGEIVALRPTVAGFDTLGQIRL
ncbi:histidine phosphatase family protein [Enterovirga aerilata]|uniref:Histidine phosphatase family protein n=1 Tax=Enterovirga aerilata TaxID=2730920 RepID=A0A849IEL0_9HYPH|nr:histidine phosphatase family protein [Enterovirga sp. DB1703]NNM74520.1 histidine phosphatase family protein [Enterovirga sp. DB1703]